MQIRAKGHYVLVEQEPIEETTESGIIIATETLRKQQQEACGRGKIVDIGPTAYKGFAGCNSAEDWGIKIGDWVQFPSHEGTKALDKSNTVNERLRFIPASKILGAYENE